MGASGSDRPPGNQPPSDARAVLVYDGQCRFCVAQASRLARWAGGRVRIESFRDPGVLERYPGLTSERCEEALQLVLPDGRVASGAGAVARTLRLRPILAPIGLLYEVPPFRALLDWGYGVVARNRFRIAGAVAGRVESRIEGRVAGEIAGSDPGEVCDAACRAHAHDGRTEDFAVSRAGSALPRKAPRARVRDLFLRLLGAIFVVAFLSLFAQATLLWGERGLLPAREYLAAVRAARGADAPLAALLSAPSIFWLGASDTALRAAAIAGAAIGVALTLGIAPRICLVALWALYLSFVSIGQDFLSFQWDNLILESAFFAMFVAPAGWRPRGAPPPHPIGVFLMLWLVLRLHVESGLAKWLGGDPTWRDLTAMATYYETSPIPTALAWYAHQMPLWAHKACSLFTSVVELGVPLFLWGPAPARLAAFALMLAMQVSILLTGNYGFFNSLSIALCLFVLDDGHLAWAARKFGLARGFARGLARGPAEESAPRHARAAERGRPEPRARTAALVAAAIVLVALSILPFARWFKPPEDLMRALAPAQRALQSFRSINAYHLFASMTIERHEVAIEGSADGAEWLPYEFRYKPGDPRRAPPFVAPHQPRVDFQLWFLALGGRARGERYFDALLARCLEEPRAVAPLFSRDPFPETPPARLRVLMYRYRFTDAAARRATGAWWTRELEATSREMTASGTAKP